MDGEDCTNTWYDFTGDSYSWGSSNTSIATLANPQTHFVGVGSTSGYAHVQLESNHVPCNVYTFQPQSPQNTMSLTCSPSSVSWGGSVTCTVKGASASQVTKWTFSAGGLAVNGPSGVLTWSGPMVVGGTITATAMEANLSQTVTVGASSRFPNVVLPAPQLVANGTAPLPTLTSPPTTAEGSFGDSAYDVGFDEKHTTPSAGPNAGIYYVASFSDSSVYEWELNPGLTNSGDPFYQHQGNCFPTVAQIVAAVQAHEVGLPGPSHYSEVQAALASSNPASVANSYAGDPREIDASIQAVYQAAYNAGQVEPPTNLPPNINYPPYRTCPQ